MAKTQPQKAAIPSGRDVLQKVLAATANELLEAKAARNAENERRIAAGKAPKADVNEQLSESIYFGRHFGAAMAAALNPMFGGEVRSGETPSASASGEKRVDVSYSTAQQGLGFMISLKSVHRGERDAGRARFTHNLKRNDEELRVEATALHLRQPYAVLVAVVVLPFWACDDGWKSPGDEKPKSSFARWVKRLWTLKGRAEPEDSPDRFELVFIALYDRDTHELGFYEIEASSCPRVGRPEVMEFEQFIGRIESAYYERNERNFHFEDEEPTAIETDDIDEDTETDEAE